MAEEPAASNPADAGSHRSLQLAHLVVAVALLAAPLVLGEFALFFIASAAVTTIAVLALNIALGFGGLLSLVHTGLFMVGAYATAILSLKLGWSGWLPHLLPSPSPSWSAC